MDVRVKNWGRETEAKKLLSNFAEIYLLLAMNMSLHLHLIHELFYLQAVISIMMMQLMLILKLTF